jgi:hypothetical protein
VLIGKIEYEESDYGCHASIIAATILIISSYRGAGQLAK